MSAPDDRPDDDVDDEELAAMADELSDVLRELRDELRASREAREAEPVERPADSSGGVPEIPVDLPSATDVLAFTDERLIPATITVLEVNIRALELLQKGIRWARPDKAGENAQRVRSHAESVSRSTLKRLDTVLADLQGAAGRGALPEDAEAGDVIREARNLRDEIDAALAERAAARQDEEPEEPAEGKLEEPSDEAPSDRFGLDDQPEVDVDVESELASIKAELGKDEEEPGDGDDEEAADDAEESGDEEPDDEETEDTTAEDDRATDAGSQGDDAASGAAAGDGSDASDDDEGSDGPAGADGSSGDDEDGA